MDTVGVVFNTFEEAMDVHRSLFKLLRQNGYVSYGDLKTLVDMIVPDQPLYFYPGDETRGWASLLDSKVERDPVSGKWIVRMPIENSEPIEKIF